MNLIHGTYVKNLDAVAGVCNLIPSIPTSRKKAEGDTAENSCMQYRAETVKIDSTS